MSRKLMVLMCYIGCGLGLLGIPLASQKGGSSEFQEEVPKKRAPKKSLTTLRTELMELLDQLSHELHGTVLAICSEETEGEKGLCWEDVQLKQVMNELDIFLDTGSQEVGKNLHKTGAQRPASFKKTMCSFARVHKKILLAVRAILTEDATNCFMKASKRVLVTQQESVRDFIEKIQQITENYSRQNEE